MISNLKFFFEQGHAAFISLLQPSDEMIELFDKILVLTSNGELAYFGPVDRSKIREIFLGDKADDPASDTGGIADLCLKNSLDVKEEEALMKRYERSDMAKDTVAELAQIRASAPPAREADITTILPSPEYSTSGWYQFRILALRRLKLISRNAVTWTRIIIALVFGIIIGSLFSVLPENLLGGLGRTGYIFLNCFLVLMLSAAVTIPSAYRERATLFKHRSAEFYSGKIAYITQFLTDAPLSILEAIVLSCTSYWWVDMNPGAGHFAYFMGTLIALECAGQALGRLLCALYRKQATANAMSSVVILIFGTVGGFMPNYDAIHRILRWLSWFTPVSYAFEGLMINEFYQRSFDPLYETGTDGSAELVEVTGDTWLGVYGLPRIQWASTETIRVCNIFVIFLFAVVYDWLGYHYIEKTRGW